jgi:hypothetical protein
MSIDQRAVILAVLGLVAAAVTAFAAVGPEAKQHPAAVINASIALAEPVCPQAPWPFGCQWDEPGRKLAHKPHSSHQHAGTRHPRPEPEQRLTATEAISP